MPELTNDQYIDDYIGTVMYAKGSEWYEALDTLIPEDEAVYDWLIGRGVEDDVAKRIVKEYYEAKKDQYIW